MLFQVYSFATNQPHTRAPFSNMLPDYVLTGPDFRRMGYGGIVAAGFWGPRGGTATMRGSPKDHEAIAA